MTTLTDAEAYSAAELADLYYQRWDVELFFRDLKTTMGMDILRCKSPAMVEKEILMHFIAYNAVRSLMVDAAKNAVLATWKTRAPMRQAKAKTLCSDECAATPSCRGSTPQQIQC